MPEYIKQLKAVISRLKTPPLIIETANNLKQTAYRLLIGIMAIALAVNLSWLAKFLGSDMFDLEVSGKAGNWAGGIFWSGLIIVLFIAYHVDKTVSLSKLHALSDPSVSITQPRSIYLIWSLLLAFGVAASWLSDGLADTFNSQFAYLRNHPRQLLYYCLISSTILCGVNGFYQMHVYAHQNATKHKGWCSEIITLLIFAGLAVALYAFHSAYLFIFWLFSLTLLLTRLVMLVLDFHTTPRNLAKHDDEPRPHKHLILFVSKLSAPSQSNFKALGELTKVTTELENILSEKLAVADIKIIIDIIQEVLALEFDSQKKQNVDEEEFKSLIQVLRAYYLALPDEDFEDRKGLVQHLAKKSVERLDTRVDEIRHKQLILLRVFIRCANKFHLKKKIQLLKMSEYIGLHDSIYKQLGSDINRASYYTPWRMPILSIEHHERAMQECTLVFSKKTTNEQQVTHDGSESSRDAFYDLLELTQEINADKSKPKYYVYKGSTNMRVEMLNNKNVVSEVGVDFSDLQACRNVMQRIVQDCQYQDFDTMVDFTSGQKVTSVATILETTSSGIHSQYIDTNTLKVRNFDFRYNNPKDLFG